MIVGFFVKGGLVDLIERVDNLFAEFWRSVLRFLCGLTGWSNFRWARISLAVAGVLLLAYVRQGLYFVIVAPGYISNAASDLRTWRHFEKSAGVPNATSVMPVAPTDWLIYTLFRIFYVITGVMYLGFLGFNLFALGLFAMAAGEYFATDFRPRRPNWLMRSVLKLAKIAKSISIPLPSPAPLPRPA